MDPYVLSLSLMITGLLAGAVIYIIFSNRDDNDHDNDLNGSLSGA